MQKYCPHRLVRSRTPPFHGGDRGSNPLGDTQRKTRVIWSGFFFLKSQGELNPKGSPESRRRWRYNGQVMSGYPTKLGGHDLTLPGKNESSCKSPAFCANWKPLFFLRLNIFSNYGEETGFLENSLCKTFPASSLTVAMFPTVCLGSKNGAQGPSFCIPFFGFWEKKGSNLAFLIFLKKGSNLAFLIFLFTSNNPTQPLFLVFRRFERKCI